MSASLGHFPKVPLATFEESSLQLDLPTPGSPHSLQRLFEVPGKVFGIAYWAGQEPVAQGSAQCRQALQIARMRHGAGNIVIGIGCNPFGQCGTRKLLLGIFALRSARFPDYICCIVSPGP